MANAGQFKKGHKAAKGGKRPGAGRPTKEEATAKQAMMQEAFDRLKISVGAAVETLVKHLSSKRENISLRAAESIVEFCQKAIEHEELEKRIAVLEARLQQRGGS